MFALVRAGFLVVVIANFRAKNDVFAWAKREAGGERGVEAGKPRALSLEVIEELQPGRAAQPRREVVGQIVHDAEPVRITDILDMSGEAEQAFKVVAKPRIELVR